MHLRRCLISNYFWLLQSLLSAHLVLTPHRRYIGAVILTCLVCNFNFSTQCLDLDFTWTCILDVIGLEHQLIYR
jgi:uncharacterized membrane protein